MFITNLLIFIHSAEHLGIFFVSINYLQKLTKKCQKMPKQLFVNHVTLNAAN
jgi:hypothetical protein